MTLKLTSKFYFRLVAGSFAALLAIGTARAGTVTGSIFENDPTGALNAIPSNVPNTTPDITFTTTAPINFASGSLYTIGEFLASGSGSTILTGASDLGKTLESTLFDFIGMVSVTNGETFTAGHDDGLTLIIDGITVINAPGPTAFSNTTDAYNGPTGTFAFQLVYGECCGAPGDLSISLPLQSPSTSPEPSSIVISGAGLLALSARFMLFA
jgi:hypothetical protein